MNPAHVLLACIAYNAVFWLGFWTGRNDGGFIPNGPSGFLFAISVVGGWLSIIKLIVDAL